MKHLLIATAPVGALSGAAFGRDLTVAACNMSSCLDPGRDHSNVGSQFRFDSFDPLIHKDDSRTEQVFVPGLATERALVSPTTTVLKLRPGVTFRSAAMTADDVVFSVNRVVQADFPPDQMQMRDRLANIDDAEKVGGHPAERSGPVACLWHASGGERVVLYHPPGGNGAAGR